MPVFNIDFHHHCNCDPVDSLSYSAFELIDRLQKRGIHACSITPHGLIHDNPAAEAYARDRGMLLLPGVEKMIEDREVVVLNVREGELPDSCSFADLAGLRERRGESIFVFAPHPFYPRKTCAGPVLDQHAALFDAVEYCHLYFRWWNLNEAAVTWARKNNKPIIANSDSHSLASAGRNYSEVECDQLDAISIFRAIRQNRVQLHTRPHSLPGAVAFGFTTILPVEARRIARKLRKRFCSPLSTDTLG